MSAQLASTSHRSGRQALLVLVGITASFRKRRYLRRYLNAHCEHEVFVPDLPYRRPLLDVAAWYADYLANEVRPARFERLDCIAYIAGGAVLRILPSQSPPLFERLVCFRGPVQERVAARLVQRLGHWLAGVIAGKTLLDLAACMPAGLPVHRLAQHEALIVEEGCSRLARWLGIGAGDVPSGAWSSETLLPAAEGVLRIPESHDEVYTAPAVLDAALGFIRNGVLTKADDTCKP